VWLPPVWPLGGLSQARPHPAVVNDVTGLNPVRVASLVRPHDGREIGELLTDWPGPVSIGGGCFSMGGQVAEEASLHLDMRGMNRVVAFNPAAKTLTAYFPLPGA